MLHTAVMLGDKHIVRGLLEYGTIIEEVDAECPTSLHQEAMVNDSFKVNVVFAAKAFVDLWSYQKKSSATT